MPVNMILYMAREFVDVIKNVKRRVSWDIPGGPNVVTRVIIKVIQEVQRTGG